MQANVDIQLAPEEWPLEPLATKMKQYCYLLEDLTADILKEQGGGDYELLRQYLRRRAVDAYWQKVHCIKLVQTHNSFVSKSTAVFFLGSELGKRDTPVCGSLKYQNSTQDKIVPCAAKRQEQEPKKRSKSKITELLGSKP